MKGKTSYETRLRWDDIKNSLYEYKELVVSVGINSSGSG
jgi:hypothetical protein